AARCDRAYRAPGASLSWRIPRPDPDHVIRVAVPTLGAIARDLPCAAIPGGGCRIYGLVHLLDAPIRPRPDAAATSGGAFPDAPGRLVLRAAPGIRSGLAPAIPQRSACAARCGSSAVPAGVE